VAPRLNLAVSPSLDEFNRSARQLIRVGVFGFGYEIAAYCKLQAPLALLALWVSQMRSPSVGLGFRLISLMSSGLSIIIPILFLRIGAAIHVRDRDAAATVDAFGV